MVYFFIGFFTGFLAFLMSWVEEELISSRDDILENIFNLIITTNNIYSFRYCWSQHINFINKCNTFSKNIFRKNLFAIGISVLNMFNLSLTEHITQVSNVELQLVLTWMLKSKHVDLNTCIKLVNKIDFRYTELVISLS